MIITQIITVVPTETQEIVKIIKSETIIVIIETAIEIIGIRLTDKKVITNIHKDKDKPHQILNDLLLKIQTKETVVVVVACQKVKVKVLNVNNNQNFLIQKMRRNITNKKITIIIHHQNQRINQMMLIIDCFMMAE